MAGVLPSPTFQNTALGFCSPSKTVVIITHTGPRPWGGHRPQGQRKTKQQKICEKRKPRFDAKFLFTMAICHGREVKERRGRYIRSCFLCKLLIKLHDFKGVFKVETF